MLVHDATCQDLLKHIAMSGGASNDGAQGQRSIRFNDLVLARLQHLNRMPKLLLNEGNVRHLLS